MIKLKSLISEESGNDLDDAFIKLQDEQRGQPESMISYHSNPGIEHGAGPFTTLAEHVGDLVHRLAYSDKKVGASGGGGSNFGLRAAREKVEKTIWWVSRSSAKIKRDMEYTLRNNYDYYVGVNWYHGSFEQFVNDFNAAAKRYAEAYKKLQPLTQLQKYGRDAAIALGEQDWRKVRWNLSKLEEALGSPNVKQLYFTPLA
jgi:hypothetical protein